MSRDLSCFSGKKCFRTKQAAIDAMGGNAKRCDHCRWWHSTNDKRGRRKGR
jgi:hypothetical protein